MTSSTHLHTQAAKDSLLAALPKTYGIIKYAAEIAGVTPRCHQKWLINDPVYKAAYDELKIPLREEMVDVMENALMRKIEDGDTSCIIFGLKTQGRHRGYSHNELNRIENEHESSIDLLK